MFRSRILGTALVLAVATTACESDPLAVESFEQIADDDLEGVITAESGQTDPRGAHDLADRSGSIFDRLAAQIPGFGGLYRTAPCVVAVVLTREADVQEAVRIVHAAIEPLVVRTCPDGIRVEPVRGQFTYVQLRRFLLASRPLNGIAGVGGAYISFPDNRLVILVASRSVAITVTKALPRVGIPGDAVLFKRGRTLDRTPTTSTTDVQQ
jgi:hypothetical protein